MGDHYKDLGLTRNASKEEIKDGFRKLAVKLHPDKHSHSPKAVRDSATLRFKQVSEAYQTLIDDTKRADYNSRSSSSHYTSRSQSAHSYGNGYGHSHGHNYSRGGGGGASASSGFDNLLRYLTTRTFLLNVSVAGWNWEDVFCRALLASLRSKNHIVLATASSGIAANILPGGRTAHSRFKLPLNVDASADCRISKQSALAQLIRSATAIIWDEAPMTHRYNFELLDRTFRDILASELPFGGKIMIFGGDFRQVLPVIPKGTKSELIQASIIRSAFWAQMKILRLRENMRSINDRHFAEFLLRVGDGAKNVYDDKMIKLPISMVVPWENDSSIQKIIDKVFPNLGNHVNDARYMVERSLITPINDDVDMLNDKIIDMFPGDRITLYSFDYVEDDTRNLYQPEFLNSLSVGGLHPHKLTLKVGAPVMLLRNIDSKLGLCNGTRLLCRGFYQNLINAQILTGHCAGTRVFLPRIPLKTVENAGLPFSLTRKQFPIKLSFSLTINKSQGQTIPHIGVYLPDHVFSHGQLYVALSRGVSETATKVLIKRWSITGEDGAFTKNVVFKEVLLPPDSNDI